MFRAGNYPTSRGGETPWGGTDDWGSVSTNIEWGIGSGGLDSDNWDTGAESGSWDTGGSDWDTGGEFDDWGPNTYADYGTSGSGGDLGTEGDSESGKGNGRSMARRLLDFAKGFLGRPEVQEKAKQVAKDYGSVALAGAVENAGLYKDGKVRKTGVLKALFRPKKTARKALTGAGLAVGDKARKDSKDWRDTAVNKGKDLAYEEARKRTAGLKGGRFMVAAAGIVLGR